jgi:tripartite-type tricarboxylate transporter receptor subunit TctC
VWQGASVKLSRRSLLYASAGAAALPAASRIAGAQAYPARPVRIIVGVAAGGANSTVARLVAQWLSERLGHEFIVENRPGAGGNVGAQAAANAAPDGYTLLFTATANAISATVYDKLDFNFARDIVPVASLVRGTLIMDVNPSFPARTVAEFIAYAKANPGAINMASAGIGNTTHLAGELFMMLTGVRLTHVPYRGGAPAVTDLLGGQVQVYFDGISGSLEYVRTGKLRALAVTSATRAEVLPDVPSLSESVPGYDVTGWYGIGAPRETPAAIVDKLNTEINAGLADPKLKARLADLGYVTFPTSPAAFGTFIAAETAKWAKVVKFAGIKPE